MKRYCLLSHCADGQYFFYLVVKIDITSWKWYDTESSSGHQTGAENANRVKEYDADFKQIHTCNSYFCLY